MVTVVVLIFGEITPKNIAKENEGHAPGMTAVIGLSTEQVKEIANGIENAHFYTGDAKNTERCKPRLKSNFIVMTLQLHYSDDKIGANYKRSLEVISGR